jgi:ADP-heptose:LPS heptosyltransferase
VIDLAVGSWNLPLARLIPGISDVLVADAPWLVRGDGRASWPALLQAARTWRARRYDIVVNFEPDIRTNLLARISGAPVRVGYNSGGGGALLTNAAPYDPAAHVATNAAHAIARASQQPVSAEETPRRRTLRVPADAIDRARQFLGPINGPIVGVHASGGRESKQWHLDRFAAVARRLGTDRGATIVLTGTAADRPLVNEVASRLDGIRVHSAVDRFDLPGLAALLGELDLFITGDTGPMHLAAAMHTPVVALFGPSDPARYGPRAQLERIVRVDLPCSPCGQVRLPPLRCRGHVPDCMDGIAVEVVVARAIEILDTAGHRAGRR